MGRDGHMRKSFLRTGVCLGPVVRFKPMKFVAPSAPDVLYYSITP